MIEFGKKEPRYRDIYQPLFDQFARKFGGSEESKKDEAKSFSTYYELYIYAFFLGLYKGEPIEIEDGEETSKFIRFEDWGKVGSRIARSDYQEIKQFIIAALIAQSDIDLIELEKADEENAKEMISKLKDLLQSYANSGFAQIMEILEDDKSYLRDNINFLNLLE